MPSTVGMTQPTLSVAHFHFVLMHSAVTNKAREMYARLGGRVSDPWCHA